MKSLRRGLAALAFLFVLLASATASAQTTTVTASHERMGGYDITVGTVTFTPVNTVGTPIAFADATGAQNGPTAFECAIVNGAITGMVNNSGATSGTCQVPDATLTTPANILYAIQVIDGSTGLRTSGKSFTLQSVVGVSGASWALDHYGPPATTTNIQTVQSAVATTVPNSCISPSIFTRTLDDTFYTCVGGVFLQVGGLPGAVNADGVEYTTVAAAAAAAQTTLVPKAVVRIPAKSTVTDAGNGGRAEAIVEDQRTNYAANSLLELEALSDTAEIGTGGNVDQFVVAARTGAVTVCFVGNSIGQLPAAAMWTGESYNQRIVKMLAERFPHITFTYKNYNIGGTTLEEFLDPTYVNGTQYSRLSVGSSGPPNYEPVGPWYAANGGGTIGQSWKAEVQSGNCDLLIANWANNETNTATFAASLESYIALTNTWNPVPTHIWYTDMAPNVNNPTNSDTASPGVAIGADALHFSLNDVIRGEAAKQNVLVADADKYFTAWAFGIDATHQTFQTEVGLLSSYPTGYTTVLGSAPTYTAATPAINSSLVCPAGGCEVARNRTSIDTFFTLSFFGFTTNSVPTLKWRWVPSDNNGHGTGYTIQGGIISDGSGGYYWNTPTLYYCTSGGGCTSLATAMYSCHVTSPESSFGVTVSNIRDIIQVWCFDAALNTSTPMFNLRDYHDLTLGQIVYGTQIDVGGMIYVNALYGNYLTQATQVLQPSAMYGTPAATYNGAGDFYTNPYSIGGDDLHHQTPVASWSGYVAAFAPVARRLDEGQARKAIWFEGNAGGFQSSPDAGSYHLDQFINGVDWRLTANGVQVEGLNAASGIHSFFNKTCWGTAATAGVQGGCLVATAPGSSGRIQLYGSHAWDFLNFAGTSTVCEIADTGISCNGIAAAQVFAPASIYSAAGTALPTCNLPAKGDTAIVSDATSPTYMAAYTSGGSITASVVCSYNGSSYAWLTH